MKVFLVQNVENVGRSGQVLNVTDGFARNYLLPRKLAIQITEKNEHEFVNRIERVEEQKAVTNVKTSALAEKIKSLQLVLKRKTHNDGKLYGAVSTQEIAEALEEHGVKIAKNQVIIEKSIKAQGTHTIAIKLSSSLQPNLSVKVVPEAQ